MTFWGKLITEINADIYFYYYNNNNYYYYNFTKEPCLFNLNDYDFNSFMGHYIGNASSNIASKLPVWLFSLLIVNLQWNMWPAATFTFKEGLVDFLLSDPLCTFTVSIGLWLRLTKANTGQNKPVIRLFQKASSCLNLFISIPEPTGSRSRHSAAATCSHWRALNEMSYATDPWGEHIMWV